MEKQFSFAVESSPAALVVVFPPGVKGLFNPQIHQLMRVVEQRLSGVFVTYALSNGSSPDLRAAMAAARFSGCESAVVVPVGSVDLTRLGADGSNGDWLLASSAVESGFDAPAVVDAYYSAVSEAERAA